MTGMNWRGKLQNVSVSEDIWWLPIDSMLFEADAKRAEGKRKGGDSDESEGDRPKKTKTNGQGKVKGKKR